MFIGKPIWPRDSTWLGRDKSNNDIRPLGLGNQSWIQVTSEPHTCRPITPTVSAPQEQQMACRVGRTGRLHAS
jgi:hypothetical protein